MIVAVAVLLGAVFVLSGVTKVAAPHRWRSQSAALGVPSIVALVVPYVELGLGALLVAQVARRWLGGAALLVLVAFAALLALRLAQGQRPACACFGALSTEPISWWTVVRNAGFAALAVVLVVWG